jgi:hypothetical protein
LRIGSPPGLAQVAASLHNPSTREIARGDVGLNPPNAKAHKREALDSTQRFVHDAAAAGARPKPVTDTANACGAAEVVQSDFTEQAPVRPTPDPVYQPLPLCAATGERFETFPYVAGGIPLSNIGGPANQGRAGFLNGFENVVRVLRD